MTTLLSLQCTLRRNFRGYSGEYCTSTFKRYKRRSFELKWCRNAWAAGAPPLLLKEREVREGGGDGRGEKEKEGEGKWYPHFLGESYAPEGMCLPFLYWIMAS